MKWPKSAVPLMATMLCSLPGLIICSQPGMPPECRNIKSQNIYRTLDSFSGCLSVIFDVLFDAFVFL